MEGIVREGVGMIREGCDEGRCDWGECGRLVHIKRVI